MEQVVNSTSSQAQFLFQFESEFDYKVTSGWMERNWTLSFYLAAIYLVLVFGIQHYMKTRPRFTLQRPLVVWNSLLALFSICATIRLFPVFLDILSQPGGFGRSVCIPLSEESPVVAFWSALFAFSKAPELVDTIFIVLLKQRLIFLHYFHHVTVLVFTWYSYGQYTSSSRWYAVMNLLIHSTMYSYYVLKALKFKIPKPIAIAITSSQIVQMFVGIIVNVYAYRAKSAGLECSVPFDNIFWAALMYGSYFYLFVDFFRKSYFSNIKISYSRRENDKGD